MISQIDIGGITVVGAIVVASNLLAQSAGMPFLKAYFEGKGKNLATKQDISIVLEQVRAVTGETEKIKAEISGGLWDRQWLKMQKRDAYVRLIETLENIRLSRGNIRKIAGGPSHADAGHQLDDAIAEFRRARALARLIVLPEAIDAMGPLLQEIRPIDPSSCTPDEFAKSQALIGAARDRVVELGRRDLEVL
jgi:hypothetical protein